MAGIDGNEKIQALDILLIKKPHGQSALPDGLKTLSQESLARCVKQVPPQITERSFHF